MNIDEIKSYYDNLPIDYLGYDNNYRFIIDNLKNNISFSFARFNDGEMIGVQSVNSIISRGAQVINESLHKSLKNSLNHKQKNYYIGIPCKECYPHLHNLANEIVGDYEFKTIAVCNINKNYAKFINEFKIVLRDKNVIWIGGNDQKVKNIEYVLELKFKNYHLFSTKNSWNDKKNIEHTLSYIEDGDVVLFSLGPTGRILSQELFSKKPNTTFIDVGSLLDPITRNVWHDYHRGWDNGFNKTKKCKICN